MAVHTLCHYVLSVPDLDADGLGFGRHSIGSNFFYYVTDLWGGHAGYYSDMDFTRDSDTWQARNWPLEDALPNWGSSPPAESTVNHEV